MPTKWMGAKKLGEQEQKDSESSKKLSGLGMKVPPGAGVRPTAGGGWN